MDEPVFFCENDTNRLIIFFVAKLQKLAAKADVRPKFFVVEAEIKTRLSDFSSRLQIIPESQPNISSKREENKVSKKFLRFLQKQLLDLQRNFNDCIDHLPVFRFKSGKYDTNLMKAYLNPP